MALETPQVKQQTIFGKILSTLIVLLAVLCIGIVVYLTTVDPRTDDAEVFANFIGMAPVVEGPITTLHVNDNQLVHKGDLLFQIDEAPYVYALQNAVSQQAALGGQIANEARHITSQESAAMAAQASIATSEAASLRSIAGIRQAEAEVDQAQAEIERSTQESAYATSNLARLEPLLAKRFVTADQVDQARTLNKARSQSVLLAQAQLAAAKARLDAARAQSQGARASVTQSGAQFRQSEAAVNILEPLTAQREARASAVRRAQYDLDHTRVYAPFEARVTNLRISEGAFAHIGQQVFTLIDTRTWWIVANFRETQLQHIRPGMDVEVYTMSHPSERLRGVVESIGYGVTPDADTVGRITDGLPDAQRTLNWVHLASRYPVRIRIINPPSERLRIGESSTVVLHGRD
jgi:multidrug efflux system membrane fusion protein